MVFRHLVPFLLVLTLSPYASLAHAWFGEGPLEKYL